MSKGHPEEPEEPCSPHSASCLFSLTRRRRPWIASLVTNYLGKLGGSTVQSMLAGALK